MGLHMDRRAVLAGLAATATGASGVAQARAQAQTGVTAARDPVYPNLLIVEGLDPAGDFRPPLIDALNAGSGPVQAGSHDAWFVFPWPAQPDTNPTSANFTYADLDQSGRPFLGAGDMRRFPRGVSIAEIKNRTGLMIHEGTHAWLVPSALQIRLADGRLAAPLTEGDLTAAYSAERRFEVPPLLARQKRHWTCFMNQFSTQDGSRWRSTPADGGHVQWTFAPPSEMLARVPNLQPLALAPLLGDLDLYLMGLKPARDCFADTPTPGRVSWIDPKLTVSPFVRYGAGLYVEFQSGGFIHFGFHDDHGVLVARNRAGVELGRATIGAAYRPLSNPNAAMMLRAVKKNTRWYFQACIGNSGLAVLANALTGARAPLMFDNAASPETAFVRGDFTNWTTVASVDTSESAVAVGMMTSTQTAILAEGEYFTFDILKDGQVLGFIPAQHTALEPGQGLPNLTPDRLYRLSPKPGALLRRLPLSWVMGAPYDNLFDRTASIDDAPRLLTRPPTGDFAVGTSCKVRRSFFSPWAGGAAEGATIWGKESSIAVSDVVAPDWLVRLQRPAPRTLRNAFIILKPRGATIDSSALASVDVLRQYYDAALPAVTNRLLLSDSRL